MLNKRVTGLKRLIVKAIVINGKVSKLGVIGSSRWIWKGLTYKCWSCFIFKKSYGLL